MACRECTRECEADRCRWVSRNELGIQKLYYIKERYNIYVYVYLSDL